MTSRDMTHGVRCSHGYDFECFDDLKAENERLRVLLKKTLRPLGWAIADTFSDDVLAAKRTEWGAIDADIRAALKVTP